MSRFDCIHLDGKEKVKLCVACRVNTVRGVSKIEKFGNCQFTIALERLRRNRTIVLLCVFVPEATLNLLFGEFDSGSERTLAAWIRHASRTKNYWSLLWEFLVADG